MAISLAGPANEVQRRALTAIPLVAVLMAVVLGPTSVFLGIVVIACLIGMYELHNMLRRIDQPSQLMERLRLTATTYLAICIVGLCLLRVSFGPGALMFTVMIAALGDIMAFFGGRRWGRHKLWPAVSPGKTWEGAITGLAGSSLAVVPAMMGVFTQIGWSRGLLVAIIGGAIGQCGDLLESAYKRIFKAKDSGRLLPGHGGLLDRVDAILPVGLFVFTVLQFA